MYSPAMLRERLAEAVKRERRRLGWTQRHTAEAAGVPLRSLQAIEAGAGCHLDVIEALCAAFDVDASSLFRHPRQPRQPRHP